MITNVVIVPIIAFLWGSIIVSMAFVRSFGGLMT